MLLIALAAFVACSVAADAAPTIQLLIVARLRPQGVAAGLLTPQNSGLIENLFTGAERPGAFGMFGPTIGMSTAPGPLAGGLILGSTDGQRWILSEPTHWDSGAGAGGPVDSARARLRARAPGDRPGRRRCSWRCSVRDVAGR